MRKSRRAQITVWMLLLLLAGMNCMEEAKADVIYEPVDSFYEAHREECDYVDRSYTANGPEEAVTVYKSPESSKVITTVENGTELYISYSYIDERDIIWAFYEDWDNDLRGWMPMEYLTVIYDHISFAEEYRDSIVEESGCLDESYDGQTVYFLNYPGSTSFTESVVGDGNLPEYSSVFVDEEGCKWGFVNYYRGIRNSWICLDMPTSDPGTLYAQGAVKRDRSQVNAPVTEKIIPDDSRQKRMVKVIAVLVLAVMLVTAFLLVILKRRK